WAQWVGGLGAGAGHRRVADHRRCRRFGLRCHHGGAAGTGPGLGHIGRRSALRCVQGRWLPHAVHHRHAHRHHPGDAVDNRPAHRRTTTGPRDLPTHGPPAVQAEAFGACHTVGSRGMTQSIATSQTAGTTTIAPSIKWRAPGLMIFFTLVALFGFTLLTEPGLETTFRTTTGAEVAEIPDTTVP